MLNHDMFIKIDSIPVKRKISKHEYDEFCRKFIFDKLRGDSFGKSFCERFGFDDRFMKNLSDDTARLHIETLGYIRKQ